MKFSTIMAVLTVALAFATTGCKYGKAAAGDGDDGTAAVVDGNIDATSGEIETADNGDAGAAAADALNNADEGSLADAAAGDNFWDRYSKCGDVAFEPVYFGFDSTVVPQGELAKADAVVDYLAENQGRVVVVEGHCDERGSNEYNLALGENRALIVRNYLVQNGIAESRVQTRSFGEESPASTGHDESAWAVNRRCEFGIYQKD